MYTVKQVIVGYHSNWPISEQASAGDVEMTIRRTFNLLPDVDVKVMPADPGSAAIVIVSEVASQERVTVMFRDGSVRGLSKLNIMVGNIASCLSQYRNERRSKLDSTLTYDTRPEAQYDIDTVRNSFTLEKARIRRRMQDMERKKRTRRIMRKKRRGKYPTNWTRYYRVIRGGSEEFRAYVDNLTHST